MRKLAVLNYPDCFYHSIIRNMRENVLCTHMFHSSVTNLIWQNKRKVNVHSFTFAAWDSLK